MDNTARTLTDLSAVDDQLSGKEALMDGLALALEERRAALRKAMPGLFLAAYDALDRMGRRPVVVPVHGAHCGGCYLRLPPQLDSSIRRRQSLCSCPHCRRFLYASPRAADNEDRNESKHETRGRLADNVRKSKRTRGIPGRLPARQEARASKRREPQGKDAHPAGSGRQTRERRGTSRSADESFAKAKSVKR